MSTYFETKAMPATLSGYKAHIYCEDLDQVEIAWNRVKDEVDLWGWGAKIAGPRFFDLVDPGHKQWGKGVTIYFPRRDEWKSDLDHLVRLMAGRPENVQKPIAGDTYAGNGVSWRFEFSPDPGYDILPGDVMRWYKEAARKTAEVFNPSQLASWPSTRPWNLTKDEAMAQAVEGWWHKSARGSESASYENGYIRPTDDFYTLPEGTRESIAYHEAGHAMFEAAGGITALERVTGYDPFDLMDLPGAQLLSYNAEEVIAEAYSVIWMEPEWLDNKAEVRDAAIKMARAAGYPLPSLSSTGSALDDALADLAEAILAPLPPGHPSQSAGYMGDWQPKNDYSDFDWDSHLRGIKQVYRGLSIKISPEDYEWISSPGAGGIGGNKQVAEWVLDQVNRANRPGVGIHWSAHRGEAAGFANMTSDTGGLRVILTAETPRVSDLNVTPDASLRYMGPSSGEEELLVKPGTSMNITRVEWALGRGFSMLRSDDGGGWTGAQVSLRTTASGTSAYRGFNVPLHDNATVVRLLGDLAEGRTDSTIKVVLDTIASGQRESWWEPSPYADGAGAGTWWSRAIHDAESYSSQADGFGIPVVFTARTDDAWDPHSGVNGQAHWYRLPPGMSVEITGASATLPSPGVAEYLLMMIERAGLKLTSFQAADWNEDREGIEVPLPTGGLPRTASLEDHWDMSGDEPVWTQPRPELLRDALYEWKGSNSSLAIWMNHVLENPSYPASNGTAKIWKAQAQAIIEEVRTGSTTPRLYRGDTRQPNGILGWSENLRTARRFAKMGGGQVWVLPAGSARGIRIADYAPGSGLDHDEREWIVEAHGQAQAMVDS